MTNQINHQACYAEIQKRKSTDRIQDDAVPNSISGCNCVGYHVQIREIIVLVTSASADVLFRLIQMMRHSSEYQHHVQYFL